MVPSSTSPIRVAIVNDFEVIVHGLQQMLSTAPGFVIVDGDVGSGPDTPADITLYDTFASVEDGGDGLVDLVGDPKAGRVVVYTWEVTHERVRTALTNGAAGCLGKELDAAALVEALTGIAAGQRVVRPEPVEQPVGDFMVRVGDRYTWPGKGEGLTAREAEVLGLIAKGCSNQEISQSLYLSINSVKSYIRSAYRKIGAERRSQAVLWAIDHGIARSVVGTKAPTHRAVGHSGPTSGIIDAGSPRGGTSPNSPRAGRQQG